MVWWLRLCAPNAGGPGLGSVPGQGTRSHTRQLKIPQAKKKKLKKTTTKKKKKEVLHAVSKTQHSQINKQILYKKKTVFPQSALSVSVVLTVISLTISKDKDLLMN